MAGQSKIYSKICSYRNHKHFCDLYYIKIPVPIGDKFDLKEGDCLVWRYYPDIKTAMMSKRGDRKLATARSTRKKDRK
jgi:bifunctional DNA-binding transcriptional regulator/antitoxin component of YhaV-PrlF toxin-antitoxin module